MKNIRGKREIALVTTGILLGAALAAPAVGAVLTAQQSSQKIFVDGQQVQMEAYSIGGSNYVRLRDVGKAVGFDVRYDALTNAVHIDTDKPYAEEISAVPTRTVPLKNVPGVGDRIVCDDGTTYLITDMSHWENSSSALPDLPTPACDWSRFPVLTLPRTEKRHYKDAAGDDLFVRNLFETRRMEYTLYNALGNEPDAWRDGKPLATVSLTIPAGMETYAASFWPWKSEKIAGLVHSRPNSRYAVEAWDVYHDGVYQHTRYLLLTL